MPRRAITCGYPSLCAFWRKYPEIQSRARETTRRRDDDDEDEDDEDDDVISATSKRPRTFRLFSNPLQLRLSRRNTDSNSLLSLFFGSHPPLFSPPPDFLPINMDQAKLAKLQQSVRIGMFCDDFALVVSVDLGL